MACVLADHLLRHRAQNPDAPTDRPPAAQLTWSPFTIGT